MCHVRSAPPRPAGSTGVRLPARPELGFGRALLQTVAETLSGVAEGVAELATHRRDTLWRPWLERDAHARSDEATLAATATAQAAAGRLSAAPLAPTPAEGHWTCPRTGEALETRTVAGIHMHVNPTCGGLMLERPSELHLRAHPELWPEVTAAVDALAEQATLQIDGRVMAYLTCPYCGGPMARRAFERVSGIVVDECPRHGPWFDARELAEALAFLGRGGEAKKAAFEARERAYLTEQRERMPQPRGGLGLGPQDLI